MLRVVTSPRRSSSPHELKHAGLSRVVSLPQVVFGHGRVFATLPTRLRTALLEKIRHDSNTRSKSVLQNGRTWVAGSNRGLDLNQRPVGYEPFAIGNHIQRATNNPS